MVLLIFQASEASAYESQMLSLMLSDPGDAAVSLTFCDLVLGEEGGSQPLWELTGEPHSGSSRTALKKPKAKVNAKRHLKTMHSPGLFLLTCLLRGWPPSGGPGNHSDFFPSTLEISVLAWCLSRENLHVIVFV